MAQPPLGSGLAGSCKSARQGLGFPASEAGAPGTPRPYLPPDILRLIDALARAKERAERLLAMNGGDLGMTLRDAARAGGVLDVRFLLAAGADAGAQDGWTLYYACRSGHLQLAEALLDAVGTLTQHHRSGALFGAAMWGQTACCQLMLERGADIHYGEDVALCAAAGQGHLETVAFLLDQGADAWSERALQIATDAHHDAVVALLLARRGGGAA